MKKAHLFVIIFYQKGKIIAGHSTNIYGIALEREVKALANMHDVIYDDYVPYYITTINS